MIVLSLWCHNIVQARASNTGNLGWFPFCYLRLPRVLALQHQDVVMALHVGDRIVFVAVSIGQGLSEPYMVGIIVLSCSKVLMVGKSVFFLPTH